MSTPEMSQEEADKLFAQVSQAMQADDSEKLSTLLAQDTPENKEQPEPVLSADEPEEEEEEVDTTETPEEDEEQEEETKPADEAGEPKKKEDEDPLVAMRAEIEKLRNELQPLKSQTGRISAVQRRLSQYDKQLADLKGSSTSSHVDATQKKIDETLKELDVTDAALAKTIRDVMTQALSGVTSQTNEQQIAQIEALRDSDYEVYRDEQSALLLEKFPNAREVFNSPHWQAWKKAQPQHIVDLATSDNAEAVGMALERYRADMIALHPELNKTQEKKQEAAPAQPVNERAQQIEEERKSRQANAANVSSGKTPARSKEPADPEALFKKAFAEVQKEISGK